jgi:putative transposase
VWNWALARRIEYYAEHKKTIPKSVLSAELTALKKQPETAWLKEVDSQALQQVLKDLDRAFKNFFEKRARFPKFKSKKKDRSRFRIPQRVKVAGGKVYVPKIGWVRIRQSQTVTEETKSATFRQEADGNWYVSLVVHFNMPDVKIPDPTPARTVGIDLGLKDFAVFSDGERIGAPKFYRISQRKLKRAQRAFSRRQRGSKGRSKARVAVARIHRRIANQRNDFLHKVTTKIVREHDGVCIEDLCIKGLAKTKLAKSVLDASLSTFRHQLTYKADWNRKQVIVVNRWFPSSKMCGQCGQVNQELALSDRHWVCDCGAVHDRDLNAANNIRNEGLRLLAAGQAESLNARGDRVRPPMGAVVDEARIPRL